MSHAKTPPTIPTVVDEAGDSPNWVPVLGLALFALVSLLIGIRLATEETPQPAADAAPTEVAAPEAPAPAAE